MLNRLTPLRRRSARGLLVLLCAALALTGCGGGGGATSAESTSAFAAGPITGFGSVIVNGVRFDDSSASVADDDGNVRASSELRLGMMAEIESSGVTSDGSGLRALARAIRFGSEIVGPVTSVAADGLSLVVLGETVYVKPTTLFGERLVGGLSGLVPGTVVDVHGLLDVATGTYTATRIDARPNALFFKLRGLVTQIDKTAQTFRIGSGTETVSYAGIAAIVPAGLDNGMLVRVRLQTTQVNGQWIAASVIRGARQLQDHDEAEIEGRITATTFPVDRKFSVNGIAVDASNALFPQGTAGIVLGASVEVKGRAVDGVILATRVSIETDHDRELRGFELHGVVSAFDGVARTFTLRGVTVSFAGSSIEFIRGVVTNLANGRQIEVKGVRSSDGTTLVATRIRFED
jgi:Domain of unknown function (DUF5666)